METIRNNIQFLLILMVWIIAGIIAKPAAFAVVGLSMVVFWRREMYAELFLGFWVVLMLSDSLEPILGWAKPFKNIYILFLAAVFIIDRQKFMPINTIFKKFIPFFIVAIIALSFSPIIVDASLRTLSYLLLFIVVPNYTVLIFRRRGPQFFKDMIYLVMLVFLVGLALRYVLPNVALSHGGRFRGIFGNPNGLGLYLIVTFVLFYLTNKKWENLFVRREVIIFYGLFFLSLVASGSRNAFISVSLFIIFTRIFKNSVGLGFIGILVAIGLFEVISSNAESIVRFLGLEALFRVDTLQEGSGRLIAWRFAWVSIQDALFLGRGFHYDWLLMRSNFWWLSRQGHEGGVHNSYLILWLNTGLVGIVFYFRAFLLIFIQAAKNNRFAVPAMTAVLFSCNFEPWLAASLNPYTTVFLVFLTLMTSEEIVGKLVEPAEELEIDNPNQQLEPA